MGKRGFPQAVIGAALVLLGSTVAMGQTAPAGPDWLDALNRYRTIGGLSAAAEDAALSDGAAKHARYVVENDVVTRSEDPGNPFFTPEGDAAAKASIQLGIDSASENDVDVIEIWMRSAFHSAPALAPELATTGYGSYRDPNSTEWKLGAVLDVVRGRVDEAEGVDYPVEWPGAGTTIDLVDHFAGEEPDPLTGCPGYQEPVGLPLTVQFDEVPDATAASLTNRGQSLEVCALDSTSYSNPTPSAQTVGRRAFSDFKYVVLIPRAPLEPGETYTASVTANGQTVTWSFLVEGPCREDENTICGTPQDDVIEGTPGDDTIITGEGDDVVHGGPGNDTIITNGGNDTIFGNGGDDSIVAGSGDDKAQGGSGDDSVDGGGGSDEIQGNEGRDFVRSGKGRDNANGGRGRDQIYGDPGRDYVKGGKAHNRLDGGEGRDSCEPSHKGDRRDDVLVSCERVVRKKAH